MTGTGQQPDFKEKSSILCVPNTLTAEEIILSMQQLASVNLELNKVENLLLLAKESEVRSDVRKFSLEKILDQYCIALFSWKHFVRETINALRQYSHQHAYHVNINPKLQFLDCFKRKFSAAYEDVSDCLRFLLRLPEDSFDYVDFEAITALTLQLEDFHTCLMCEEIEEGALKAVLKFPGATKSYLHNHGTKSYLHNHGFQLAQELNKKRVGCIVALELLKSSVKLKDFGERAITAKPFVTTFVTRADVAKYLMMKSKLVIYIPSSSSSFFENILSSSQKVIDLLTMSDVKCKEETDPSNMEALLKAKNIALVGDDCQLQKHEIDMNRHSHLLFEALSYLGLKTYQPTFSGISWIGIPKDLLAPVRNQGKSETCAFQASLATTQTHYKYEAYSDTPSRTFSVTLCEKDMDKQYEKVTGTRLGHEKHTTECKDKKTRLENSFIVLQKVGVLGYAPRKKSKDEATTTTSKKSEDEATTTTSKKSEDEEVPLPIAFRISSFTKYSIADLSSVSRLLRDNNVMAGYFRLSRSYFTLSSGQVYKYDPQQPLLTPDSKRVHSHAVMLVGVLPTKSSNVRSSEYKGEGKKKITNLAYQNSYGKLFGEHDGFSSIEASSIIRFFLPVLQASSSPPSH